jgi:tetratricopeptide (TPR) repeat protein
MKTQLYIISISFLGIVLLYNNVNAGPTLNLLLSGEEEYTLKQGYPLVFDITIVDYFAQSMYSENIARAAEKQKLDSELTAGNITQDVYSEKIEKLDQITLNPTIFGTDEKPWFNDVFFLYSTSDTTWQKLDWQYIPLIIPKSENYVEINQTDIAYLGIGIDPEQTMKIALASYNIKAGILTDNTVTSDKLPDTLWSTPVKLNISGAAGKTTTWSYEARRDLAMYWLRRGEYQKALDDANYLLTQQPKDINALQIKADAFAGLGNILEAIDIFQQAIELFDAKDPQPSCPPDYLIERYQELIWQIGPATE